MLIVPCDSCGNDIRKHHSRCGKNNFCCRECYLDFRKAVEYKCEGCGKVFKGTPANANRFCSRDCYDSWHDIKNKQRECPTCKTLFLAKSSKDVYCSWECYNGDRHMPKGEDHWNWQDGITTEKEKERKTPEYYRWRLSVLKKDDYTCQKCGKKDDLRVHHIYSFAHYRELRYETSNGVVVCEDCHKDIHSKHGYNSKEEML